MSVIVAIEEPPVITRILAARNMLHLVDSQITASVFGGEGAGGNIFIDPDFVILQNSKIIANAVGGPGGNITIVADHFIADHYSEVRASNTLNISAPDTDISSGVTVLPKSYLDTTGLLRDRCAARKRGERVSSLVMAGRGGLPIEPADYLPSGYAPSLGLGVTESAVEDEPDSTPVVPVQLIERVRAAGPWFAGLGCRVDES